LTRVSVRLGVVFPQTEIEPDAGAVRAFAQCAEQLGLNHVSLYDHVVSVDSDVRPDFADLAHRDGATAPRPYDLSDRFHEVMVLMGFLAGVCSLELATGILVLPQRQTALVAKQAAEVDLLTGGRVRLGVGIGWNRLEFDALGADFDRRMDRLEQQIDLLRRYWTETSIEDDGIDGRVTGVGLAPRPVQRPIPIWIAGGKRRALERVGRLGDGWLPVTVDPAAARTSLAVVRAAAIAAGRDPDALGIEARLSCSGPDLDRSRADLSEWADLGATHIALNTMGSGLRGADAHAAALTRAVEALRDIAER
jgi:probable F420-dependent oxidoreductase